MLCDLYGLETNAYLPIDNLFKWLFGVDMCVLSLLSLPLDIRRVANEVNKSMDVIKSH